MKDNTYRRHPSSWVKENIIMCCTGNMVHGSAPLLRGALLFEGFPIGLFRIRQHSFLLFWSVLQKNALLHALALNLCFPHCPCQKKLTQGWKKYQLTIKGVKAWVCPKCGEKVYDPKEVDMIQDLCEGFSYVSSLDINSIPINPFEICNKLHIDIYYESLSKVEALLLIKNGAQKIILNQNIAYQSRLKFTVAHEIGHFYIPYHDLQIFACQASDILSFNTDRTIEQEANIFASELLMPTQYIQKEIDLYEYNAESVKKISDKFSVSVTAAAIRLLEFTHDKAAIILSQNGKVKWFMKSKNFKFFIKTGILDETTYVYDFFNNGIVDESLQQTYAHAWLEGKYDMDFINEQSIFMPNLNMVLTILTIPFAEDEEDGK